MKNNKKYVPLWVKLSLVIFIASALLYYLAIGNETLADSLNGSVSNALRKALASLSSPIPFSLFELLLCLLLPFIVLFIVISVKRDKTAKDRIRRIASLVGVISLIFTSYIFTLGIGYRTTPLSVKLGIEDNADIKTDDLYKTTVIVRDEMNALAGKLHCSDGETVMPYSFEELSDKIVSAYDSFNSEYSLTDNFKSCAKAVHLSSVMSDLRIMGIYSFPTGESNINMEYPDYNLPFTVAHEFAHQRGISRENEANFVAFLVCISSDDDYIRYSGYLNLYEYLISALYRADKELYDEVYSDVSSVAVNDIRASNRVYLEHQDSILGEINDRVNDTYLKLNGTEGTVTYGYIVRLAVSFYCSGK